LQQEAVKEPLVVLVNPPRDRGAETLGKDPTVGPRLKV